MSRRKSPYRQAMERRMAPQKQPGTSPGWRQLADQLEAAFQQALFFFGRQTADGLAPSPTTWPARNEKQIWRKLAQRVAIRLIDPVEFVYAQFFDGPKRATQPPSIPRQLLADACMARYEAFVGSPTWQSRVLADLTRQAELARDEVLMRHSVGRQTTVEATLDVLCDQQLTLAVLYRYSWARSMAARFPEAASRFDKVAARWETQAAIDYIRHQSTYDASCLGTMLPEGFREKAIDIYRDFFSAAGPVETLS